MRLYPKWWRERYRDEVHDLVDELVGAGRAKAPGMVAGLVVGAAQERARPLRQPRRALTVLAIAALAGWAVWAGGLQVPRVAGPRGSPSPPARPTVLAAASFQPLPLPPKDPFYTYPGRLSGRGPWHGAEEPHRLGDRRPDVAACHPGPVPDHRGIGLACRGRDNAHPAGGTGYAPRDRFLPSRLRRPRPACDPSYTLRGGFEGGLFEDNPDWQPYLYRGFAVVVPDYEGTTEDFGAGQEAGYGTLDGIRAAEAFLKLSPASTPVGLVGYSGGAIATDYATELAPAYAPGLDIVGAAEGGVPADYAHEFGYINASGPGPGVAPVALVGLARAFHANLDGYLSASGKVAANALQGRCLANLAGRYEGLTAQRMLKPQYHDILTVPWLAKVLNRLIMSRTGTPREPLLIANGESDATGDGLLPVADVRALARTYCQRGVPVQFQVYKGLDHEDAAAPFEARALGFLIQRLTGRPVANGCNSIGQGGSLAP